MTKDEKEIAFIALINEYKRVIYKICYLYSNSEDDLKDLYQDVVLNLWHSYQTFKGECKLSTWVYRVALNTSISLIRREKKRKKNVPLLDFDIPYQETSKMEDIELMYRLINRLQNTDKMLILLWLEEKSYDEISEIIGISKTNVAVKLSRAKIKLKNMFNKEEGSL